MKKLINIIVCIHFSILVHAQTNQTILNVPYVPQYDLGHWCWAASIASIVNYYGNPVQLCDVLEAARNLNSSIGDRNCCDNYPSACISQNVLTGAPGSISDVLATTYKISNFAQGVFPNQTFVLPFSAVVIEIGSRKPILFTWHYYNGGGHALVIRGYDASSQQVYYINPAEGYHEDLYEWVKDDHATHQWDGTAQLQTLPPPCPTEILQITGPNNDIVCSSATFTINNTSNYAVTWDKSPNLTYNSGQNTNSYVVQSTNNAVGLGWVSASINTCPNTVVPRKDIWVGVPVISNVSGPGYNQVGAYAGYSATVSDIHANVTSFNWTLIPGIFNNYFNPGYNCYITWNRAGQYVLQVNAQNNCPSTSATYYYPISVVNRSYLSISPNPASDNVQVSIIKPQNTLSASDTTSITPKLVTISSQDLVTTYTIKIYNPFGTLFYSTRKSGDTFTIPVNNIKNGTYIIEANDGKQSFSQQLIIEH